MSDWKIFTGQIDRTTSDHRIDRLPPPPPWREFSTLDTTRGQTYKATPREIEAVNAALYLRRPLLVTGKPGSGKSSLAYAVAEELGLTPVLRWSINSRSTRDEGLYHYDAIARLREANLRQLQGRSGGFDLRLTSWGDGTGMPTSGSNLVIVGNDNVDLLHIRIFDANGNQVADTDETKLRAQAAGIATLKQQLPGLLPPHVLTDTEKARVIREVTSIVGQTQAGEPGVGDEDIGRFLRLGPLGTALLPGNRPRVLLIDEIDKSDIDLPNDLLHVFEEGRYEIPELMRIAETNPEVRVLTFDKTYDDKTGNDKTNNGKADDDHRVTIYGGKVRCTAFPFVLMTSNGERDLPPAFFRRCLRLTLEDVDRQRLEAIIGSHLKQIDEKLRNNIIDVFLKKQDNKELIATDQLLNSLFLITRNPAPEGQEQENLIKMLMEKLG